MRPLLAVLGLLADPVAAWPLVLAVSVVCGPALVGAFGVFAAPDEPVGRTFWSAYRAGWLRGLAGWAAAACGLVEPGFGELLADPDGRPSRFQEDAPASGMGGGTAFPFSGASPAEALETAREAAGGQDVRLGGGPTMIRDFLAAGLVDHMHVAVVPILLGRGVRLWDGLEALEDAYDVEAVSSPIGVTHLTFTRKVVS